MRILKCQSRGIIFIKFRDLLWGLSFKYVQIRSWNEIRRSRDKKIQNSYRLMSWFLITFRCSFSSGIFFLPTRPTCSNIDHSNMNEVRREKVHMRVDTIECAPLLTCLGKAHFFGDYFIEILVNRERRYVTCRCCHRTNRRSWHEHTWSYFFFYFSYSSLCWTKHKKSLAGSL